MHSCHMMVSLIVMGEIRSKYVKYMICTVSVVPNLLTQSIPEQRSNDSTKRKKMV